MRQNSKWIPTRPKVVRSLRSELQETKSQLGHTQLKLLKIIECEERERASAEAALDAHASEKEELGATWQSARLLLQQELSRARDESTSHRLLTEQERTHRSHVVERLETSIRDAEGRAEASALRAEASERTAEAGERAAEEVRASLRATEARASAEASQALALRSERDVLRAELASARAELQASGTKAEHLEGRLRELSPLRRARDEAKQEMHKAGAEVSAQASLRLAQEKELAETKRRLDGAIARRDEEASELARTLRLQMQSESKLESLCFRLTDERDEARRQRDKAWDDRASALSEREAAFNEAGKVYRLQKRREDEALPGGCDLRTSLEEERRRLREARLEVASLQETLGNCSRSGAATSAHAYLGTLQSCRLHSAAAAFPLAAGTPWTLPG